MIEPVLLVRGENNETDARELSKLGIPSLIDPYIKISPSKDPEDADRLLDSMTSQRATSWVIATSANGPRAWAQIVGDGKLREAFSGENLRFAAVGATSAQALKALGASEVFIPKTNTSEALAKELVEIFPVAHAFLPIGDLAMEKLPQILKSAGWEIDRGVVYTTERVSTEPVSADLVRRGRISAVLLRSPSAARAFTHFVPNPSVPLVCAGETTSKALSDQGLSSAAVSLNPSAEVVASTIYSLIFQES